MNQRRGTFERANRWANQVAARLTPHQIEQIADHMLATIDEVSSDRWEAAQQRANALPGTLRPEKLRHLTRRFSRELGAAGLAVGAAAAAPAIGTGATLAATFAEMGWFTARAGDLVLTIAALHGRPAPTADERRAWVLALLIYGSSARNEFKDALGSAATGLEVRPQRSVPLASLQAANQLMSRAFLRRYGTRRGLVGVLNAIPVGVGAALGGAANYLAIRRLARDADQFFARLPYSAIDVDSTDITGRELSG